MVPNEGTRRHWGTVIRGLSIAVCALWFVSLPAASSAQTACDPDGPVQFVCGPVSPEDLVAVPDSAWVIVSSMEDEGHLYAADTRDLTSTALFPTETFLSRHDTAMFGGCPGPSIAQFRPHGLSLRPGPDRIHTLYVVRHGAREAIEVFRLDARAAVPTLTWVGCVVAPDSIGFNSVAALPGEGFAATNFSPPSGEIWEWQPASGWTEVPGSETSGPNGLVASSDGRWLYIGGWGTRSLIRISRGETPVQRDVVEVGFHIDNVRWAPDGTLFAAGHAAETGDPAAIIACLGQGQCDGVSSRVAKVDPERLTAHEIVRYRSNDLFILGTVAIQVGDEVWVGGIGGRDRIARFPAP